MVISRMRALVVAAAAAAAALPGCRRSLNVIGDDHDPEGGPERLVEADAVSRRRGQRVVCAGDCSGLLFNAVVGPGFTNMPYVLNQASSCGQNSVNRLLRRQA
jgi:hypothetical protein